MNRETYARIAAQAVVLGVASLLLVGTAQASTIILSQASSDETDPAGLDAVLDFSIIGGDQLSLEIDNTSAFTLNEFYFNGSADVTSVALASVSDASLWGPTATMADGFGSFDFAYASTNNANGVQAGSAVTFLFDITGSCADTLSCDMADFVGPDTFSVPPPPDQLAQAAAKFVMGPGDDSAFGAANGDGFPPVGVPEPVAGLLLAAGVSGLYLSGRRLRS